MPGQVVRAFGKQIFDFSGLNANSSSLILGAKAVDVSQFREVNGIVRLHAIPNLNLTTTPGIAWPTGASVTVSARIDAPTNEDPADFMIVPATDIVNASVTFTQGTTDAAPSVKLFNIVPTDNANFFGAWLRIYVKGSTGAGSGTAFQVMLSCDINGKS